MSPTKPKILFYGINFYPELISTGKYTTEMSQWFAENDFDVRVVTAPPYYPDWKIFNGYTGLAYRTENIAGCKVYRCPLYVPKKVTTIKRLIHLSSFALSSIPMLVRQVFWRPQAIVLIVPTILCLPFAILISKISRAKLILHIQDFELDAMLGLNMLSSKSGFLKRVAFFCESWMMRQCDMVTTIAESMRGKLIEKKVKRENTALIPNWTDLEITNESMTENEYRKKWNIPEQSVVILYSGNIGLKQGLEMIIHAADYFSKSSGIVFLIVGKGAYKNQLVSLAAAKNLANIQFHDLQPTEKLSKLLAVADIHLVLQKKGAADNVFPSKLTNILSIGGTALISADKETELGRLVLQNPGVACLCEPERNSSFIKKLEKLIEQIDVNHRVINSVAYNYASKHLRKEPILSKLKEIVLHEN